MGGIVMVTYVDDKIYIESEHDLEQEMCRFNCTTREELENLLWLEYGVVLIFKKINNYETGSIRKSNNATQQNKINR